MDCLGWGLILVLELNGAQPLLVHGVLWLVYDSRPWVERNILQVFFLVRELNEYNFSLVFLLYRCLYLKYFYLVHSFRDEVLNYA